MGFKGVAVTDDLLMAGATASASLPVASRQAIEAGNDLLMTSRIIGLDDPTWTSLLSAYRKEPAFRARVREAATRVLKLKLEYLRPKGEAGLIPEAEKLQAEVPDPQGQAFFASQAKRAATALDPKLLPWKPAGKLLVAAPTRDFLEAAASAYPGAAAFRFQLNGDARAAELAAFTRAASGAQAVLVCVQGESTMAFVEAARGLGKKVAIISLLSPEPLARRRPGEAAVAVYGFSRQCMEAGLAVLSGEEKASGSLPLALTP
jgi:beta-N-acetylhexosaminidase